MRSTVAFSLMVVASGVRTHVDQVALIDSEDVEEDVATHVDPPHAQHAGLPANVSLAALSMNVTGCLVHEPHHDPHDIKDIFDHLPAISAAQHGFAGDQSKPLMTDLTDITKPAQSGDGKKTGVFDPKNVLVWSYGPGTKVSSGAQVPTIIYNPGKQETELYYAKEICIGRCSACCNGGANTPGMGSKALNPSYGGWGANKKFVEDNVVPLGGGMKLQLVHHDCGVHGQIWRLKDAADCYVDHNYVCSVSMTGGASAFSVGYTDPCTREGACTPVSL